MRWPHRPHGTTMDRNKFAQDLMAIGIVSYREQESLWRIAQRCAKTTGLAMGGAGAVMGTAAGSVTLPVVGAVPGYVAGFLAGLAGGTITCTIANRSLAPQLRELARNAGSL